MTDSAAMLIKLAARQGLVPADVARLLIEKLRDSSEPNRRAEDLLVQGGHCTAKDIERLRLELAAAPASDTQPPPLIGGYRLKERLGSGGMGEVYRAEQVSMHRLVALKLLSPELLRDASMGERFLREARAAGAVNHPNVVGCYDVGMADGRYFMALEYVSGGDAERFMRAYDHRLGVRRALEIIRDCARGLEALHQAGFVHRDIKPSNILLTDDGVAKVGDLGLVTSQSSDHKLTHSGMAMGTPAYMSPEQADGEIDLDRRTDVYSLGASLFYLLTGHPPFTGKSVWAVVAKVINEPFPDPRKLNPDVSAACAVVLLKATAKDRLQRYQTGTEFRLAIDELLQDNPAQTSSPTVAMAPTLAPAPVRPTTVPPSPQPLPTTPSTAPTATPQVPMHWLWPALAAVAVIAMLLQGVWIMVYRYPAPSREAMSASVPTPTVVTAPVVVISPPSPPPHVDPPGVASVPPAAGPPPVSLPSAPQAAHWLQQPPSPTVVGPTPTVVTVPPATVVTAPTSALPPQTNQHQTAPVTGPPATHASTPPVVAVLGCDPGDASLYDFAKAFPELLTVALTRAGSFDLVERTQLRQVLGEQELTQSGVIDSTNAARIGHLVGARVLITQRVYSAGDYTYVSAKAIEVESGRVKAVSKGDIKKNATPALMASFVAIELGKAIEGWSGVHPGENDEANAVITQLAQAIRGKRLPTVVIAVEESHLHLPAVDPAVRTELGYILRKTGFRVIESDSPALGAWAKEYSAGKAATFPSDLGAVQVVIAGSGISETGGVIGALASARARLELSAIVVSSGQVLSVQRATVSAADASETLAGKTALEKAVRQVAVSFATDLITAWNQQ